MLFRTHAQHLAALIMITDKFSDFYNIIKTVKGSLLAIDFGLKNVGIAITDNDLKIAMPLIVLNNHANLVAKICDILTQNKCIGIICGWPLDMHGGVHTHGENILFLCGNLFKLTALPILLWDESMSTKNALAKVYELDTKRGDKFIKKVGKGKDDHLAAQFMLNQILDKISYRKIH
jgi:putative Holliday junction resolvase